MTHVDKQTGQMFISDEPPGKCELCGKVEETRPYGPNSEQICFSCGQINPDVTRQKFFERLQGRSPVDA
jgi:hypothetical protein